MALSPETMREGRPSADPNIPPPQANPSGFLDPMPGPATPLIDGVPQYWTLYPYPQPPSLPVLPAGMWPWESPVAKAFRAEKGDNPNEPPVDYNRIIGEALGFPFTEHAFSGESPPSSTGGVPPEGPRPGGPDRPDRPPTAQEQRARAGNNPAPPAASQH